MTPEELNNILGDQIPTIPTFLEDKAEKINETVVQDIGTENTESSTSEKNYKCKYCGQDGFHDLPSLMTHSRKCEMRPPKPKKEKKIDTDEGNENMLEDDNLPGIFENETTDIVETETAKKSLKSKSSKEVKEPITPTIFDRLSKLLRGYNVSREKGIVQSAEMYDVGSPTFIPVLKNLLVNAGVSPPVISLIVESWGQIVGIKTETEVSASNVSSSMKTQTPTDALSLMAKLRDEEIQDSIVSSYQEKLKSKKLENEIAMKRLNGELNMENKNSPDISKIIELEMLKYQMMQQQKTNPELEMLKLQMMQPKTNPEVDMLKSEFAKLQLQLSSPRTDSQVELLKQQLESQNKKYEDIQRKIEEDNKTRLLSDQHKQEMDLLKQQIAEQSKQTQELMKTIQTASSPKIEDTLKIQISEIQKQSDAKLQTVLDQLRISNESKKEEEYRRTIETLKDEIKNNRDQSLGAVGQVADSMKSFATDITHVIEKRDLKDEYTKREDELKKKISDAEHNRSMTNEQYVMEKTGKIAEEAVKAIGTGLDGFGKALQPATKSAAESSAIMERAALAMDLKSKGFDAQTINNILSQPNKSTLPSARSEFESLQRVTDQIQNERNIQHNTDTSIPQEPSVSEQSPEQTVVKFATGENE